VTVSRSNVLASAELRAGIGVMAGAAYSSALTTFENADLDIKGGIVATVSGPLVFTGDDQCRLTGGNYTGERTKLALVRKEGDGELLLSAAVAITGRLEVASGKVRFPSRAECMPVVGKPSLMGSVTNAVAWIFQSPDQGEVPCVYDTVYPHGTDLTSRWNGSSVYGPRTTMVRGYVWNRTGADVTWTFKSSHADCIWFWLDDEAVFTATRAGSFATRTLTPGPHKFAFITTSTRTSAGSQYVKWVNSTVGSLYDSMPVDFTGQANPAAADLSQFTDPGDGSLFTLDDTATEDLTDPFWLASIDTMAFAPAAEFDLGGYDYTLANLEGAPTVSDAGTLTVGESWKLDPETLASESKLVVSGNLAFAGGAALGLTIDYDRLALPIVEKLDAGLKIASVTGALDIANLTLTPELQSLNATLTTADEGKSLVLTVPATKYMRATETGLELGFSVLSGRPYKEVRLDVYRDGVLVAQKFLGDGHALSGEWTFDGSGYYVVKTVRSALVSDDPDETEFVTVQDTFGQLMVSGERTCIVSTEPGDGEYATIIAAVDALGNAGGRVYARPGTYAENNITNGVEIATPVQVIGMTDDPAKVVVTRAAGVPMRIFRLNHAGAALRFLTIRDGSEPWNDYLWGNGGNVLVADNGGSIENCVIRNGSTGSAWAAGGGNVALFNGTMRNCVLIGGMNNQDTANMWANCGGSLLVYQRAGCAPVVENCLITGCVSAKNSGCAPIGLYGDARLVNCTVVSNGANVAGGVMLSKMNGKAPQIVNCAFYDNTIRSTPAYDAQVVYGIVQTYRNKAENTPTDAEAAACFVNCAAPVTLNATCVATDEPGFADSESGDYTLTATSPLVNAGYNTSTVEGVGQFDLLGSPRFVGRRVDVGCYEYRASKFVRKGSCILVR